MVSAWGLVLTANIASAQMPPPPAETEVKADKPVVLWEKVVPILPGTRCADVGFTNVGLNMVQPVEMVWAIDRDHREIVAVATKPITGTATAGETMGKRGSGQLRAPAALAIASSGSFVLEEDGHLTIVRSGWTDSLDLRPVTGSERDVAVPTTGLVYVLAGPEVRVFADPPAKAPLWKIALDKRLLPAVSVVVSASGTVFVAGRGKLALAAYELDANGVYRLVKSRTAAELNSGPIGGIAITPNMLLPLAGREGWVGQDRFLVVTDSGRKALLGFESKDLTQLASVALDPIAPGLVPGRLDVSNRGQIAIVDATSGAVQALPALVLAQVIEPAKIRWRTIEPDSVLDGGHGP
jgi:hypothetical protein